tara:strand:+ start:375 stop:551 length:177 start_codon:yes stop_codon:yes gene_type:complete
MSRNPELISRKLDQLDNILTNLERIVNTQEPIETYKVNLGRARAIVTELQGYAESQTY